MNADRLLALYEKIADAPDAIPRLRRFILDLAVRGKLVEQDPADEPASELLKRVSEERKTLLRAKRIKRVSVDPIPLAEIPFLVPSNWEWTRLGNVGDWGSGSTPSRANTNFFGGDITWLKSGELNDNRHLHGSEEAITQLALDRCSFRMNQSGDLLIAMYGATIGKLAILAESAVTNQAVCGCTPFHGVLSEFLFLFLLSQRDTFRKSSKGGAQPNISKVKIVATPFPLPPLSEQRRIVAKVNELMALCDHLEGARTEREETRDRLSAGSLARLNAPDPNPAVFRKHATFGLDNLAPLTTRPDQIKAFRQSILNLAVRGKLVPQDPADEPASELLKQIGVQRAKAPKARKLKSSRRGMGDSNPDLPDLPHGWQWVPLAKISDVTMGQSPPGITYNKSGDGVPLINGPVEFTSGPFGRTIINQFTTAPRKLCEEGDLLICVRGSTTGRTNVAAFRACIGRGVAAIRSTFDDGYIRLFLWKARADIISMGRGMAFPSVSKKQLENLAIPLPPLPEQRRIVAKVDELMALCDRLEASLGAVEKGRTRLLDSLLHEALGSTFTRYGKTQ